MLDKKDLDFVDILKRTLHKILEDPNTRKELEKLLVKEIIEYAKRTGYKGI